MPRILFDPSLETCPDYSSETYDAIRSKFITETVDEDAAAAVLAEAWHTDRDLRKEAWDEQVQDDAEREAEAVQQRADEAAAEKAEAEAERAKKRPKLPAFDAKATVPNVLQPRPSNFAKHKVAAFEYVDLWYFTVEGCRDADSIRSGSAADEAFGLTQSDNLLELKPMSSYKAAKRVVRDEDLTWSQVAIAATGLLQEMEAAQWPKDYLTAFASFFYALGNHHFHMRGAPGEAALVIYQARTRRSFHDDLKAGKAFNIAVINSVLLDSIQAEYNSSVQQDELALVCNLFPRQNRI
ncbi:hypothetical protein B0H16DRAFT_1327555 [Mycena metata]|uniref:Uncharacterized protein n=1 Tax=Mycena metata TaxID=1033252 RepID=A0AAD7I3T4_9AGAR|nr:hypothetical protein B0H16DRAFT_1327555 [Mycena metata]